MRACAKRRAPVWEVSRLGFRAPLKADQSLYLNRKCVHVTYSGWELEWYLPRFSKKSDRLSYTSGRASTPVIVKSVSTCLSGSGCRVPLSSEYGIYQTVKSRL